VITAREIAHTDVESILMTLASNSSSQNAHKIPAVPHSAKSSPMQAYATGYIQYSINDVLVVVPYFLVLHVDFTSFYTRQGRGAE